MLEGSEMWRPFGGTISTSFLSLPWNGGFEGSARPSHCPCLDLMVSRGRCCFNVLLCAHCALLCAKASSFFSLCSNSSSYQIVFDLICQSADIKLFKTTFRLSSGKWLERSLLWVCMLVYCNHNLTFWFDCECISSLRCVFSSLRCVFIRLKSGRKSTRQKTRSHREVPANMECLCPQLCW